MKRMVSFFLTVLFLCMLTVPVCAASYRDVPAGSSLAGEVEKAAQYGLMNGYDSTNFGYYDTVTRAQFATVLGRMLGWFTGDAHAAMWDIPSAMEVPATLSETYLYAIEQAQLRDVVDSASPFRPNDAITRGEMAEMLVRALGLKSAAQAINSSSTSGSDTYAVLHGTTSFTDLPWKNEGYITIAYAIGMTKGMTETTFAPNATATRAQAAAMLVRIYEKLRQQTDFVHGFYAISSYGQIELAEKMDAVSAGWSRMIWDGSTALLSTTGADGNEYCIPTGYADAAETIIENGSDLKLSVFMTGQSLKALLASESGRTQAVEQILNELTISYHAMGSNPYSGVTIDFEGLSGADAANFTAFLRQLSAQLKTGFESTRTLYVCVSPVLSNSTWYDGYDYAAISSLADKVILMAYDYDPLDMSGFIGTTYYQNAATEPVDQVYLGLRAMLEYGVDADKIMLGFSRKSIAWQIDASGRLLSGTPVSVSNDILEKRLAQADTITGWSNTYQQPYATYTTEGGGRYFVWYDNQESTQIRLNAAKLLGITGVSLWRIGTLPTASGDSWMHLLHSGSRDIS